LSTDSDFGLSGNYGKPWAGRYYVTQESLITGKANPSIAYLVNDWLSVGVNQRTVEANLHFSDTCQVAIGQQLRFGEK
jgi:long-chain fatty acid transport protein